MSFVVNIEHHRRGVSLRETILGKQRVERALAGEDDLIEYHHLFGHECAYAQIWGRPGLAPMIRSICAVGMLAICPTSHSFQAHIRGAILNGATRTTIRQVLATISFYLGAGIGTQAVEAAREELGPDPAQSTRKTPPPVSAAELRRRGEQFHHQILGNTAPKDGEGEEDAAAAYGRIKTEYYFGVLWHDPDLSPKVRVLLVISILISSNRLTQLEEYLRAARRLGCTHDELKEVFLTAAIYCGAPACEDGLAAARMVFSGGRQ